MPSGRDGGAIRSDNLIAKIGFVFSSAVHGTDLAGLREALIDHLDAFAGESISAQAIRNWFPKESSSASARGDSLPRSRKVMAFLGDFVEKTISYGDLSPERKQVRDQILKFVERRVDSGKKQLDQPIDFITISNNGNLVFRSTSDQDATKLGSKLEGFYIVYKMRFAEDREVSVAKEAIKIFRRGREVRFEAWYRRHGENLNRIDGVVMAFDQIIWMFGMTVGDHRLRISSFKDSEDEDTHYNRYRWGLCMSDIAFPGVREPAASRILMIGTSEPAPGDLEGFLEGFVHHVTRDQLRDAEPDADLILRLIDNHVTAISVPFRTDPATDDGSPILDEVLKVDQNTMNRAIPAFQRRERPSQDD